jgi:hypothetical protein
MLVHGETNLGLTEPPPLMGNDGNTTLQRRGGTCLEKPLSQQADSLPRVAYVASKRSMHEHHLSSNDPMWTSTFIIAPSLSTFNPTKSRCPRCVTQGLELHLSPTQYMRLQFSGGWDFNFCLTGKSLLVSL